MVVGYLRSLLTEDGAVNKGRKFTMLLMALCVVPIVLVSVASEIWMVVVLLSLATAAHQGWSANLFTTVSDLFPRKAVASVVGIGGMGGAIGGMLIATIAGLILQFTGSYFILFIICGSVYLVALAIIQLLVKNLEPIDFNL